MEHTPQHIFQVRFSVPQVYLGHLTTGHFVSEVHMKTLSCSLLTATQGFGGSYGPLLTLQ